MLLWDKILGHEYSRSLRKSDVIIGDRGNNTISFESAPSKKMLYGAPGNKQVYIHLESEGDLKKTMRMIGDIHGAKLHFTDFRQINIISALVLSVPRKTNFKIFGIRIY